MRLDFISRKVIFILFFARNNNKRDNFRTKRFIIFIKLKIKNIILIVFDPIT